MKNLYRLLTLVLLVFLALYVYIGLAIFFHLKSMYVSMNLMLVNHTVLLEVRHRCDCKQEVKVVLTRSDANTLTVYTRRNFINKFTKLYDIKETELEDSTPSCGLYNTLIRGPRQNILSYSLFGTERSHFYYSKLVNISQQIKQLYSNQWLARIYHDDSINKSIICDIECATDPTTGNYLNNVEFCHVGHLRKSLLRRDARYNASYIHPRMWRWLPLGDRFVSNFASRDVDSFILKREVDAVSEWLKSNKSGHVMRDHKDHGALILAGMWGFRSELNRPKASQIFSILTNKAVAKVYNRPEKYMDQDFLQSRVYPLIRNESMIHDSYLCTKYQDSIAWPTRRSGNCYVGLVDQCDPFTTEFYTCPVECRPGQHADWDTC